MTGASSGHVEWRTENVAAKPLIDLTLKIEVKGKRRMGKVRYSPIKYVAELIANG